MLSHATCNVIVELLTVSAQEQQEKVKCMMKGELEISNEETMYKKIKGDKKETNDKGKKTVKGKSGAKTGNQ